MKVAIVAAVVALAACAKRAPDEPAPVPTTSASIASTPSVSASASVSVSASVSTSASAPKPKLPRPVRCGSKLCMPGEVCCNPLMEMCAPPGVACPQ